VIYPKNFITVANTKVKKSAIKKIHYNTITHLKRWILARVNNLNGYPVTKRFLEDIFYEQYSDKEWLRKLKSVITTNISPNTYEYAVLRWNKEIVDEKWLVKRDSLKGESNPAHQHGGRLSPFSDKFVKYVDGSADYSVDDVVNKKNQSVKDNPQNQSTRIEYYLAQGMSEENAQNALSDRQCTFSLDMCIEKYGENEGRRVWQNRQDNWQRTLSSMSIDEIDRINMMKGVGRMNQLFNSNPIIKYVPGVLYYIRFFNDEMEFWKIGITSKSVKKRFWPVHKMKHGLKYEIVYEDKTMTFYEAFKTEQKILRENSDNRMIIDYNGFKTTEAFSCDII
jgi:hypothetical protein